MSRDPLDELSSRLFAAARREQLPRGAEQRALEAARLVVSAPHAGTMGPKLLLLAASLAGLALVFLALSRREQPKLEIAAERASSSNRSTQRPPATAALPARSPTAFPSVVKTLPSAVLSARPVPVTLADELDALKVAQQALAGSDTQAALKALNRYDRVLKGQKLRAEATLLRIEALSKSGQGQAAAELASRFARQNPTSPLVDRARSFIKPGLGGLEND